jgi:acetyl-CoA acetyltransferase family protein
MVDGSDVEEVVFGCANQAGEDNRNVARMAVLLAGLPVQVPAQTVNRLCGSGMQAVVTASREIQVGAVDVAVAGGVESMSRAPWVLAKPIDGLPRGSQELQDTALGWRFVNPRMRDLNGAIALGKTAENVARAYGISRRDQDVFALRSHRLAVAAQDGGRFADELIPIDISGSGGEVTRVVADEGPRRDSTLEALARLRPAFASNGTVTAGNSSPLNDGAAALLLMSAEEAHRRALRPLARFIDAASAGVDPNLMGMGPVEAVQRVLRRPRVPPLGEFGLVELNEAFASQVLACQQELGLEPRVVNVNGGATSLGHPLGCSGARIVTTLLHEMRRRRTQYGLATMCIGVGQGIASAWELVDDGGDP